MGKIYDLIIIGGGSAGLSAGIYAGRSMLDTLILEKKQAGGQLLNTAEVANYPGVRHTTGPALMREMQLHALDFGVQFADAQIDRVEFAGNIKKLYAGDTKYEGRAVILATGALPRHIGFPGEEKYTGHGVSYCSTCDGEFFAGLDIFVIGGGNAAADEALFLTRFGKSVTVIVRKKAFSCAKITADKVRTHPRIKVHFNTEIIDVQGDELMKSITFRNNKTEKTFTYEASEEDRTFGVFVFAGYEPATALFAGQVRMDESGYILTDDQMRTSVPGVFAAGDLRPKSLRQLVTAVADGAIAATSADKYVTEEKDRLGIRENYSRAPAKAEAASADKVPAAPAPAASDSAPAGTKDVSGEFFDKESKEELLGLFRELTEDMTIVSIVDPSKRKSLLLRDFIEAVAALDRHIHIEIHMKDESPETEKKIHADKFPVAAFLDAKGIYRGIKFHGVPADQEIRSFALAIYNLAGPGQPIDPGTEAKVKAVKGPFNIKVCVSMDCHMCPDAVAASQRMALLNPGIEAEMIDAFSFPDIQKKYRIMSVPTLIINDEATHVGGRTIPEILEMLS
ncbi:MAG: thioredoxin-disulfide reductase [Eubacteriales bacterium]